MFFNPQCDESILYFSGSGDPFIYGASLPKNGINSLTDAATGFIPDAANISSGVNSPTNLAGNSGSVNLAVPEPIAGMLLLMAVPVISMRRRR
jgi:hypothetical protein